MHYLNGLGVRLVVWKPLLVLAAVTAFLLIVFFHPVPDKPVPVLVLHKADPERQQVPLANWTYNPSHDHDTLTFTSFQCASAFPDLFAELDRSVAFWTARGGIDRADIDIDWRGDAAVRAKIVSNQLYIVESKNAMHGGYRERTLGVLHSIHRALLTSLESVPDIEFSFTVDDMSLLPVEGSRTIWTFARRTADDFMDRLWLMPDFNFWAWPSIGGSFANMQRRVRQDTKLEALMTAKIPQVVWRGVRWTNEQIRGALIDATMGKGWADVQVIDWSNQTDLALKKLSRSYSGRLNYLLNCRSVPIIHDLSWTTHYYHLLSASGPMQNYIAVQANFSDLEDKVYYYLIEHPDEAQRIADNAVATFRDRYTSPAAEVCYWRHLFKAWASVSFQLDLEERGVTYEEYMWV
ncbi:hypothetical protein LTR50_004078 [Elasticomyces elasticus]|nr:hypothetical protein LTR50_004078 [Elasticomyces elasticus]